MARKLKVFQAQFGFFDSIVAAPSQAAALRAWGTRQNLFEDGQARAVTEAAAVKAALAHPQTPLRRPAGAGGAFEVESQALPKVPDAPKRSGKTARASRPAKPRRARPPADRSALDAAEAALRTLEEDRKAEEAELARRRDDLDAEVERARGAYVESRKAARAAVGGALDAYREAGGRD